MDYLKSGKETPPKPQKNQVLFVDMWGGWTLYEDYYGTFNGRVEQYVKERQRSMSYFNPNYIRQYIQGS